MKQAKVLLGLLAALVFLAAVTVVLIVLFKFTKSDFVLGVIGAITSVGLASYQFRKAKEHEAEARLFSEKATVYKNLILLIADLFKGQKLGQPRDIQKTSETLQEIRTQMIIWGSARTIRALDSMGDNATETDPKAMMNWLAGLYAAIRADLGHKDDLLAAKDIALGHVVVTDRHQFR